MKQKAILTLAIVALSALVAGNILAFSPTVSAGAIVYPKGFVIVGVAGEGEFIFHCQQTQSNVPCGQCSLVKVLRSHN